MRCHEVDYEIIGHDMQMLEVELDPNETVVAEAGAMNYMEDGIEFHAKMGDGSDPGQGFMGKIFSAGKRMISGESLFMTHFTNHSSVKDCLAVSLVCWWDVFLYLIQHSRLTTVLFRIVCCISGLLVGGGPILNTTF